MFLHFYLRFSSVFGQNLLISGNIPILGNDDPAKAFSLQYLNDQLWYGFIEIDPKKNSKPIRYKYLLRQDTEADTPEFGDDRLLQISEIKAEKLVITDDWNYAGAIENAYYTSPFEDVLLKDRAHTKKAATEEKLLKKYTHEFRVKAPLINKAQSLCISGAAAKLGDWKTEKIIPLTKNGNWWTVKMDLSNCQFPLVYKYGIYDKKEKKFIKFEEGKNRVLASEELNDTICIIHDGFAKLTNSNWKATGVAIPVFSLRSKNGFGTGEFTDLKLLVDWAAKTGIKMIQLLPVNDTTATYSWKDSYPYAAISAFALHPLLLNLETVAGKTNLALIKKLAIKKRQLNKLAELDYEQVIKFKMAAARELYALQKESLKDDFAFFTFFELNRHWLEPYAAFSFLRDKYKTSEFDKWRSNAVYDETAIQRLVTPSQKHYDDIAVHYFIQYHLHLQLKKATEYAHNNGVIIKGDIPIGICRNSVDAWMEPGLYHMNEQAGAPPDAFAVKGQNWGFPTYNWQVMQQDNFTWWRKRFDQMSNYFDAFRIDHILGFFRIWSIPSHAVEGIMGRFVPAIAVSINELFSKNIGYDWHRFTKPFINEAVLNDCFGENREAVENEFFEDGHLKEKFDSQRKVEDHFATLESPDLNIKQGLFDLISNVILFEVDHSNGQQFHFRISMEETASFKNLDTHSQAELKNLYIDYFYRRQEELWRKEAMKKLPGLKQNTNMLVCGEDLGMVPHCVPEVMAQLGILSLEIQRMPKKSTSEFFHPNDAPYLSVVSPSTHDMSTVREWWEEDAVKTRRFYQIQLGHNDAPPFYCEPWISKEIIMQHLYSPAMWSVFQLQDLLGMNAAIRRNDPKEERINNPADPDHYWNYRMHINLEDLEKENEFNEALHGYIKASGR